MPHATAYESIVSTAFLQQQRIQLPSPEPGQDLPDKLIQRVNFDDDGSLVSVTYELPASRLEIPDQL